MFTQDTLLYWLENDLLCFAISVLIAGILIPKIILIAFRRNLFDEIDERKIHRGVVPRLGGIAFFPAFLFSLTLVVALNLRLGSAPMIDAIGGAFVPIYFEICAIILLYLVGIADDLIGVRYMAKFVVQIVCAILLACSGMYIDNLYGILWLNELPDVLAWLFSILVTVYVVNAINLIDGIDGLASGLSSIALIFYAVVFFNGGEFIYSLLAVASAGTLFPFFYYNVFGDVTKQKKIFMGDTGALTTGMVLVFCAIAVMCAKPDFLTVDYNPAIVALSPLIVPCFDVFRVYFHRVKKGRNPFLPDKCHIHHKILALGMNQAAALLTILGVSIAFIGINVLVSPFTNPTIIFIGDVVVWTIANILLTRAIRQREKRLDKTLYD
ncbi:MraY family glycosyltransferase [Lepagella muris]|uniref:Undecaprenyl/decaprenyl-phosphate alpha-N-acetylglucosaminyl 1-phosphate transferase n=1 Tax=Lepagella muris TaxID=3032870 RepID=A0AC61RAH4_9BACT|nr:MraY family glycosyltransferase [Lepagella muris]ROT04146.1 undecaprenyl/decaprenyl-phosphate alpha-N-acetylglucosaminyl 1-phosphate transferase [Muribaculaceae bacterium Isolate-037 (Harlan)]TGY76072.1 undecaprenyl/decaprenyl-phosphate alpha-N-acetylglucosaminyl 1-phosphate transferase [Lepagella muris]THG46623.1 undecaprenyl/decaprenyl-phosphate alpha-N-acetylglucosaminyl 1-phosphate transferase [Bacteroidales bacterium]TKC64778.1 undecaprenyl/decaprenyl-phosphate alpha-N-acetylglucosaminy